MAASGSSCQHVGSRCQHVNQATWLCWCHLRQKLLMTVFRPFHHMLWLTSNTDRQWNEIKTSPVVMLLRTWPDTNNRGQLTKLSVCTLALPSTSSSLLSTPLSSSKRKSSTCEGDDPSAMLVGWGLLQHKPKLTRYNRQVVLSQVRADHVTSNTRSKHPTLSAPRPNHGDCRLFGNRPPHEWGNVLVIWVTLKPRCSRPHSKFDSHHSKRTTAQNAGLFLCRVIFYF